MRFVGREDNWTFTLCVGQDGAAGGQGMGLGEAAAPLNPLATQIIMVFI